MTFVLKSKSYHFLCEFRMISFAVIIFVMKVQTSQPLVCFSNLEAKASVCLIDIIWFDRHSKELHLHLTLNLICRHLEQQQNKIVQNAKGILPDSEAAHPISGLKRKKK